jgi:hypothetical protein
LLTDALPFDGLSIIEVLSHVLSAAPKSLHEALPERAFDPALDAIVSRCLEKKPEARYQTMADLAAALGDYLAGRRDAAVLGDLAAPQPRVALEAPSVLPGSESLVLEDDDGAEKIRIPGVHARWPGVLLSALVLAAAALYLAHSSGRIRIQPLAGRWLYPARLGADVALSPTEDHELPRRAIARGVFATEPTHEANGAPALRAVPEVNADGSAEADSTLTPLSTAERAAREAAYRAYLRSQSLIPAREIDTPAQQPANTPTQEPVNTPAPEPTNAPVDATPDPPPTPE